MGKQLLRAVAFCSLFCPQTFAAVQTPATARLPGKITGIVMGETGPLASAGVTVRSAVDSAVVGGAMTAADGSFRVEGLAFGKYRLRISFIGYKPHNVLNIVLSRDTPTVQLGAIRLEVAAIAIAAVEAQAEKSAVVVASDRTVYNTKAMPVATTGKAVDVLRSVPELEVDMNGKVTLRGNQAVAIHFDGHPAPLRGEALTNFLQQMPGNRIARVEVIPNPSAKYDPEGMGGIVNIVMKEGMDLGLSGNLSMNASTRLQRGSYARLNYQRGRFTFFAGSSLSWSDSRSSMYDLRQNLLARPVTFYETNASSKNHGLFNMFDFTTELKLGKQATFWVSGTGYSSDYGNNGHTAFGMTDEAGSVLDKYDRETDTDYTYGTADFNTGFKQVYQPMRHEFTIDLRRRHNGNSNGGSILKLPLLVASDGELTLDDNDGDDNETSLQADYTRPLGAKAKIDAGVRISNRDQSRIANMLYYATPTAAVLRSSTSSSYLHEEELRSAYATLNRTFGKFNVQGGIRVEDANTVFHVRTTGDSYDNDYTSFFPSGNVAYDFGKGRTVRFSYSKRISRPYPGLLNPYNPSSDPLNRFSGNPYLKPNYTHSLSLDYSIIGQALTLRAGPFYRRTVDNWDAVRLVDSLGISTITYKNIASIASYGSTLTGSIRPTPTGKLGGSVTVTAYREIRDASNIAGNYSTDALRWSLSSNGMFRFNKTLTGQLFARFDPPRQLMQGRISGMTMTSLGVRKQFWGTKASANLSVNDPLDLYHYSFKTNDVSHVQTSRTSFKMRMASVSVTYNFGRPPQQNSRRQQQEQPQQETVQIR